MPVKPTVGSVGAVPTLPVPCPYRPGTACLLGIQIDSSKD